MNGGNSEVARPLLIAIGTIDQNAAISTELDHLLIDFWVIGGGEAEINAVELRPGLAETASADIPPQHQPYWLAVEIFRQTGEGWTTIAQREATEVPHTYELDGRDVVLEIAYS